MQVKITFVQNILGQAIYKVETLRPAQFGSYMANIFQGSMDACVRYCEDNQFEVMP
jgi:hypothetical protein